ncbi:hypothetical protein Poli38472_009107 [Pythium oligandrum]|uniref:Uncharacterized protein n=1 Tax=Pythium oligandrum TaxID=41045 RepID=A0A8K1CLP9_PYTOL|nr:hypothetical protein Poli38472_009107 [Pythium oligandrum]|eukprot:TMW64940.1 hypothetical protein Poli38472_009107 [Pythium oligandrum]
MWNAIVQRYRDEELAKGRELSEADCRRLRAMGLKIPKGVDPRQLYCFQTIESKDDGGLMQVLRRLEEARGLTQRPARRSHTVTQTTELVEVGAVKEVEAEPMLAIKVLPANVPSQQSVRTSIKVVESPVKPSSTRGVKRSSIQISVQEDPTGTPAKSSRKRKESPIGGLFSPRSRTPSPGAKSRRTSVLNKFETPDQPTVPTTPQTLPVPPKRLSLTSVHDEVSTTEDEEEEMLKPKHLSFDDGLVDDTEDDSRACCDQGMFVPIWDALERTTTRVQNAWEEYSKGTSANKAAATN